MPKPSTPLLAQETTGAIIGSLFDVHGVLGFGYREMIYALAVERDLTAKGHRVDREVGVMIHFRGEPLARQVLDMIVDGKVIVEIKSTEALHPEANRQLFSYLRASTLEVELLLHFGRKADFRCVIHENKYKAFCRR